MLLGTVLLNTSVVKVPYIQTLLEKTGELRHPRNFLLPLRHFYLVQCKHFRIGNISGANVALMVVGLSDFHSGSVISQL